jgi:hypothetical protein
VKELQSRPGLLGLKEKKTLSIQGDGIERIEGQCLLNQRSAGLDIASTKAIDSFLSKSSGLYVDIHFPLRFLFSWLVLEKSLLALAGKALN